MTIRTIDEFKNQIESLLPYVAPILVYPKVTTDVGSWITGGSALIAQTASRRFLVTADHFVAEIDQLRQKSEVLALLGIGASFIDITSWPIIAQDDHVDICTIQVPDEPESRELDGHYFSFDLPQPMQASIGDRALIMGFPQFAQTGEWKYNQYESLAYNGPCYPHR